jgi:hypothetical protein
MGGRDWAVVGGTFAAVALVAAVWLALDRRPPEWDHANHLEHAVHCADDLARGDWSSILGRTAFYPPLVPCSAALAYRLAPSDVAAAQAVVIAFLGVGMAATYLLARRFAGWTGGMVAAVLFGTAPFVVWHALRFQLDLPLAAMVALALEVLLRTERFRHAGWSLVAGIVFGLGMLTKPPFLVYVLPPLVIVVAARLRRGRRFANLGLWAVAAIAVSLPWYAPRLLGLPAQIGSRSFKQAAESGHVETLSSGALLFYPTQFPMQFGAVAVALFVVGVVVAVRRGAWLPLSAILPVVIFFLIRNKNLRYTLPLLPAAAVLAGIGFTAVPRRARAAAAGVVAVVAAIQVSTAAFGIPPAARLSAFGVPLALEVPPRREDWRQREILALITRDARRAAATVSVVPNHPFFGIANFRYYSVRDGLPLRFARAWDEEPLGIEYMIVKTGDVGPSWTAAKPRRIADRLAADAALARVFPVIGEFALPDGSTGSVRARRVPTLTEADPERLARAVEAALRRRAPEFAEAVEGLAIRLGYDREILAGRVDTLEIAAGAATVGELKRREAARLRIYDVRLVLRGVLVNPFAALDGERFEPLAVQSLRLERATIRAEDLQAFLATVKGFPRATVVFDAGAATLRVHQSGPDVTARVRLVPAADRPFALLADHVTVGGVPVPASLVNLVMGSFDPSLRLADRLPFAVQIAPVTVRPDALVIGGAAG